MNEGEWLECSDPGAMLGALRDAGRLNERKARMFAVACCRRIWDRIASKPYRDLVEVAERYADGQANYQQLRTAQQSTYALVGGEGGNPALSAAAHTAAYSAIPLPFYDGDDTTYYTAALAAAGISFPAEPRARNVLRQPLSVYNDPMKYSEPPGPSDAVHAELRAQARLLRDIIGNPFHDHSIAMSWLTPKIFDLAQLIYEERTFDRMPELAKVLEEAGCNDSAILSHCREDPTHVRGCWVLDALLGKEQ